MLKKQLLELGYTPSDIELLLSDGQLSEYSEETLINKIKKTTHTSCKKNLLIII